jgi:hypothetical protein
MAGMKSNQKDQCAYLTPNKTHPAYLSVPRSTEVMSGYKSRFFSVLMFLAIVCGMSLGENYIFWLFGALFLLMSIMGLTSSGIYEHGEKGQNAALLAQLRDFTPPLATNSLVSPPPSQRSPILSTISGTRLPSILPRLRISARIPL